VPLPLVSNTRARAASAISTQVRICFMASTSAAETHLGFKRAGGRSVRQTMADAPRFALTGVNCCRPPPSRGVDLLGKSSPAFDAGQRRADKAVRNHGRNATLTYVNTR
jgi:hypothetical protein